MVYRSMFMGYSDDKYFEINKINHILGVAISIFNDMVFMYVESDCQEIDPDLIVRNDMKSFPNNKRWMQMIDIFHYSSPKDCESWKRSMDNKASVFQLVYLKPEMLGLYIFYHFKLQEEGCGSSDKYGMIFLLGNLLVMYLETPREAGLPNARTLPVNNLPNYSGNIIENCSIEWDDYDDGGIV